MFLLPSNGDDDDGDEVIKPYVASSCYCFINYFLFSMILMRFVFALSSSTYDLILFGNSFVDERWIESGDHQSVSL